MNKNDIGQLNYRKERLEFDSYFTPPSATEKLLSKVKFNGSILEPASGSGHISKVLESHGYKVMSSDLRPDAYGTPNVDFLASTTQVDNIVTNPPYSHSEEFVKHALWLSTGKVAMLFRLAFLESARRYGLFTQTPLTNVYVLCKRLPHWDGVEFKGSATFAHAWFIWENNAKVGETKIDWLL